jgi:hypothetical protein
MGLARFFHAFPLVACLCGFGQTCLDGFWQPQDQCPHLPGVVLAPRAVQQVFVVGPVEGQLALEAGRLVTVTVTSAEVNTVGRFCDQVSRLSVVSPVERDAVGSDGGLGERDRLFNAYRVNQPALKIRVDESTLPV